MNAILTPNERHFNHLQEELENVITEKEEAEMARDGAKRQMQKEVPIQRIQRRFTPK